MNEGRGEIKQSSCFHWPILLYGPYFKAFLFVLDTPEHCGKSSNGWQLTSSTGNLTPRVVLTQPPPLPATDHGQKGGRFNARTLGWTGVSLRCWSWPYREPPGTGSLLFLAPCWEEQTKDLQFLFSVVSRCFLPADRRAAATWALAFAKAAGMCLMNGYAVFKVP